LTSRAVISLIFGLYSPRSFILFLIKETKERSSIIFTLQLFLTWIKTKNFLFIILNNLNSIYGSFLNKNFFFIPIRKKFFFILIRLENCISEYWIEFRILNTHVAQKLLILFLNLSELKNCILSIHNSELSSIHDVHRKC